MGSTFGEKKLFLPPGGMSAAVSSFIKPGICCSVHIYTLYMQLWVDWGPQKLLIILIRLNANTMYFLGIKYLSSRRINLSNSGISLSEQWEEERRKRESNIITSTKLRWPRGAIQLSILIPSKLDNFQFPKLHFSKLYHFQSSIFPNSIVSKVVIF